MSKINGVKLVRSQGKVDVDATVASWEKREVERFTAARDEFRKDVMSYMTSAGAWDERFTEVLTNFWTNPQTRQARISKSVIVSMCVVNMVNAGLFPITRSTEMTDLFAAFLDANIGDEGEKDSWMTQGKGRNAQVWLTRREAHIV